ncbi:Biuret amidohydrolase [Scedosporium apiospermum]|uniref:Biuret amidohydrolase n=1 Tax=Pseudallescheria apiosperma TaxID=563466 RepID=A0A084G628_PSEDA|nr:Biuret amidohydrolase [Scedosporium apiospermum]KEZ42790.1 Biuret amidohydrolase [Scedosporium apiospermum]
MVPRFCSLTAAQALGLLKDNTITVEEYALSLLDRIKERDSIVKAWAYLDPAFVLGQARTLDQIPHDQRGPLHGLAVGVKDIMNTKDMSTQFGSPIYQGHQAGFDSSAVAILRAAGSLIFGKTTTTEFAVANSGPETANPHDPNRTPGSSSCRSAAAIADLQVPLSLGAQTGGSIIRPASFTVVFAMKPTFNAIPLEGQTVFAPTFVTFGFFAHSIEDLQLLANVFALRDDKPPEDTPLGVNVEEASFPSGVADAKTLERIQKVIILGEAQVSFLKEYQVGKAELAEGIRDIVENTSNISHKEWMEASDTAVDEAPLGLGDMGSATFNTMWMGFHMPVINISLEAPRFCDQLLLRTSKVLSETLMAQGSWEGRL